MRTALSMAAIAILAASASHAEEFVCPDEKSEELRLKAGEASSAFRREKAGAEETIAILEAVIAEARLPLDREGYQQACRAIASIMIDEEMADSESSALDGCAEGIVAELLETRQRVDGIYGDPPYLPIVRVAPVYPAKALEAKLSGWVIVEFTVTRKGRTDSIEVVESSDEMFERAALGAARKLGYIARKEGRKDVDTPGVRSWYSFDYEDTMWDRAARKCR